MWAAPLFLALTALAQAGEPGPTPTPFPRQEVPAPPGSEPGAEASTEPEPDPGSEPEAVPERVPESEPDPAAIPETVPGFLPPATAPRPTQEPDRARPRSVPDPVVVPTLGVAMAFQPATRTRAGNVSFPVWAGVGLHGLPGRTSFFTAAGVEIDMHPASEGRGGYTMWVPETRFGVAFLRDPLDQYFNVAVPNAALYGIAGWKIGNEHERGSVRLGFGVTSPWMLAMLATAGSCPVAVPSMFELTKDLDGRSPWVFRMGWSF